MIYDLYIFGMEHCNKVVVENDLSKGGSLFLSLEKTRVRPLMHQYVCWGTT
jgi:hypothetical protein